MKKSGVYFALLSLAALLLFLSSCGEGQIIEYGKEGAFKDSENSLNDFIMACKDNPDLEACKQGVDISSAVEPSLSSSSDGSIDPGSSGSGDPGSSGSVEDPSSGSGPSSGSVSSSSSIPYSSSIKTTTVTTPCKDRPEPANISCGWLPNANPISGDKIQYNITFNEPIVPGVACTQSAMLAWEDFYKFTATIPVGEFSVSGTLTGVPEGGGEPEFYPWPGQGDVSGITAYVECKVGTEIVACGTKTCPPLTIRAAPAPTVPKALNFTNFSYSSSSSRIFFIGATPAYNEDLEVTNNAEAKCDLPIQYRLMPGATGGTEITGELTASHVGAIRVEAYTTCRNSERILATAAATVVPNPSLSGSCEWNTKNDAWGGGASANVKATPTIKDQYGRTCDGPYFAVGGTKKEALSTGLKVDDWNGNSNQTMTGITISATCGTTTLTPAITCPTINVLDPDATCDYQASWCNNKAISDVYTGTIPPNNENPPKYQAHEAISSWSNGRCFFITGASGTLQAAAATFKINGQSVTCNVTTGSGSSFNTCVSNIEDADGGYYIFIPSGTWLQFNNSAPTNSYNGLNPNCK